MMNYKQRSVDAHQFAMIPSAEVPRSSFKMEHTHKTTFDAGLLVPVYVDEILPGDSFNLKMTAFGRLATPIFPVMDNLWLESFFFFVPKRLIWDNWQRFMGEQDTPGASISYVIPTMTSPVGGYAANTLFDYMGLPTVGQVGAGSTVTHNCLPLRAYTLIYNQWFRDENLATGAAMSKGDGPDLPAGVGIARRMKRPDYFTTALPWPQKGGTPVSIPLGTSAPVKSGVYGFGPISATSPLFKVTGTGAIATGAVTGLAGTGALNLATGGGSYIDPNNSLYADLSLATAATINQLRQSFQIQRLLERDARGGTRYTEIIRSHFKVTSPDARLQRPEYLGGGRTPIIIAPIAQTSATGVTGGTTPVGTLGAYGTTLANQHGFSQAFTEHGYVIGIVNVRADLTYQQGLRKMWSRSTRYDFYFPVFAMLGEQAVLNKEIYCDGSAADNNAFGYQERWAEYRFHPSRITGLFKSTTTPTIDNWHLAQRFVALPTLNETFIQESPPLQRVLAVGAAANGQQIIFDSFFEVQAARPMPLYSVPGMIDHF